MLSLSRRRNAGDLLGTIFPGYKEKLWAKYSVDMKKQMIGRQNDKFESALKTHQQWGKMLTSYKTYEKSYEPTYKSRKPSVDWRRQEIRGTLHAGKFYEGPAIGTGGAAVAAIPSDYTPGNTFDRMSANFPNNLFSEEEWKMRKQYRSWDMVKVLYYMTGGLFLYRLTTEWPVVWC
ncbi:unnamed protein product [Amoebophrya sp. A120]|nr:unnamed protein product [Amoebophrya sp. A120]|eukprot:GSA120T00007770001.1